jgi:pyocin large subunit-like protein
MNPNRRWLYAFVLAIIVMTTWFARMQSAPPPSEQNLPPVAHEGTETRSGDANGVTGSVVWSKGHDGAAQNAEHHWLKHGGEFPEFHSAGEYEAGALAFIRTPPRGTLTKHRSNGDTLFYDPDSNTFAVADRRGEPRTFFRPDSGRAYWERQ